VVILIFIVREDSEDARPRHLPKRMPSEACVPGIVECVSELLREPERLIKSANRQQPGIGRQQCVRRLNDDRFTSVKLQRTLQNRL